MDDSEKLVLAYLSHKGFTDVVYEPDGNVPPDFLVDERVAVEVRRLNQNEQSQSGRRGLEEVAVPLWQSIRKLATSLGPPTAGTSWFVSFDFARPVVPWKQLKPKLRQYLEGFRDGVKHEKSSVVLDRRFKVEVFRASKPHQTFFVMAGFSDRDSGGWVLPEMERNLNICITEKTRKIATVRTKYPEWWLALVDHIGYGLDDFDRQLFREQLSVEHDWDKVILVDPRDPTRAFEV